MIALSPKTIQGQEEQKEALEEVDIKAKGQSRARGHGKMPLQLEILHMNLQLVRTNASTLIWHQEQSGCLVSS